MNKIIEAILKIATSLLNRKKADKIDSVQENGVQEKGVQKIGISEEDFLRAAKALDCDVAAIKAFAKVESRGTGFLPDGKPVILFERHIFHRLLKQKGLSCDDTSICATKAGGYLGGSKEHGRLEKAVKIDRDSALQSASWGMFQVMAFNWKLCGYTSLQDFINAAY